ncbi:MAG: cytochrome b [Caulobacter sp.]
MFDTPERYGLITRILHWSMAYLVIWQFFTVAAWRLLGDTAIVRVVTALGPDHGTTGILTLALLLVRVSWFFANRTRRPPHATGTAGRLALAAHVALYALMGVIPALALVRAGGAGKGLKFFDWQVLQPTGVKIDWMTEPANTLHSPLAWFLSALIVGHVLMAVVHRAVLRDNVLSRMTGARKPRSP